MNNLPPLSDEIKNKINELIAEKLGIDLEDFTEQSNIWDDLGMDNLDEIELIIEIEKHFSILINDEHWEGNKIVSDIYETVNLTLVLKSMFEGLSYDETKILKDLLSDKNIEYNKIVNFRQYIGRTNREPKFTQESFDIFPNNEISAE